MAFRRILPEAFVAGVGTGGTIMGVGRHRIQGISDDFIPPILALQEAFGIVGVDDGDAILMARKLAGEMGIGVGISSRANFIGALKVQNEIGGDAAVVTVFPDDNKKYLSTDLLRDEPAKSGFLAPEVRLLSYRSFKRVCHTCCDPADCVEAKAWDLFRDEPLPPCPRRDGSCGTPSA